MTRRAFRSQRTRAYQCMRYFFGKSFVWIVLDRECRNAFTRVHKIATAGLMTWIVPIVTQRRCDRGSTSYRLLILWCERDPKSVAPDLFDRPDPQSAFGRTEQERCAFIG